MKEKFEDCGALNPLSAQLALEKENYRKLELKLEEQEKAAKQRLEEQEKDFQRQMKEFKSIQTEQPKCKEQEGASMKCEAQIEEIEREYDAEVVEAIDKFAKVTTLVIKASKKAIKCKRELRKLTRKCPV